MKLIYKNPVTPGTRHKISLKKGLLSKVNTLCKNLRVRRLLSQGRSNSTGHITVWHRGGGCKKLYRNVNFNNEEHTSWVLNIEHDPYRTSFIALLFNLEKKKFNYSLASQALYPGSIVACKSKLFDFYYGNRTKICNFPAGALLFNVGFSTSSSAIFSRAAGTYCQLVQKKVNQSVLRMPSGKLVTINSQNFATFGRVSNKQNSLIVLGKAGCNRLRGYKSIVRGVAMNPVDHPHGGRTKGGRPSVTPWGKITKGKPTVKNK